MIPVPGHAVYKPIASLKSLPSPAIYAPKLWARQPSHVCPANVDCTPSPDGASSTKEQTAVAEEDGRLEKNLRRSTFHIKF